MGKRYKGSSALGCFAGAAFLLMSCRHDNPAFEAESASGQEETSRPSQSASTRPQVRDESSGPNLAASTSTAFSSSSASMSIDDADAPSESVGDTGSTQSSSESWVPPANFEFQDFCGRGAVLCYPITAASSQPGMVQDRGPTGNHIVLDGQSEFSGVTDGTSITAEPVVRAMYLRPDHGVKSMRSFAYAGGDVGFDLWFLADDPTSTGWALFELDGVLALTRGADKSYTCVAKGTQGLVTASLAIPDANLFTLVSCSLQAGKVQIQINGAGQTQSTALVDVDPTSAALRFGRAGTLIEDSPYTGRFAMLRVWENPKAMLWSTSREAAHACKQLGTC